MKGRDWLQVWAEQEQRWHGRSASQLSRSPLSSGWFSLENSPHPAAAGTGFITPAATLEDSAPEMSQTRWTGERADMLPEIAAAVGFLSSLLRTRGCVSEQRLQVFSGALQEALTEHYKHHWFPEKPSKGSGYRCIRINHKMDPIISKVARQIGLSLPQLYRLLPSELTLWVDPYEVSYRIGEDGSICVLYEEGPTSSSYGLLTCKNQIMLGRSSPSKNYVMAVSS
ncbi:protein BTG2 [Trichosurus vulpecula]|uniref:protein BTG2 n=1 Tax=Trichosurus vulpecula TaxID=9337 RepID=UPI00186B278C|nr:protein BTG2 [Trichosurus vulpecula]